MRITKFDIQSYTLFVDVHWDAQSAVQLFSAFSVWVHCSYRMANVPTAVVMVRNGILKSNA